MASIRKFLQERLKLKINEQKSAVDRPWKLKFRANEQSPGQRLTFSPRA
ncbi:hypothetical protein [Desulfofundulus thermocisternus]|nr:hypothetical protein [Desulfofundulus thermocisternus]MCS5694600.1 hypothetical protein [Desulfofundulus thermocisternus]